MTDLVQTPAPEQERPRLGITFLVAVGCFAVGVAVVSALLASPGPTPRTREASPNAVGTTGTRHRDAAPAVMPVATTIPEPAVPREASPREASPREASPREASPREASPREPVAETETTATQTANGTPTASQGAGTRPEQSLDAAGPAPVDTALTLIQGRVAYVRCDGLRSERGRFPCPRDAALEQGVWDVLASLPRCAPNLGRGGVDVRLDLVRGERTQVRVLAIAGSPEPSLDNNRVYACVGSRLARLSTSLDPIYMMVSFRAALR